MTWKQTIRMNEQLREPILAVLMAILLVGLFAFDMNSPMAFADHEFYVVVVLVATVSRFSWMPSVAAGAGTLLTIIGGIGTPWFANLPPWVQMGNRFITIVILWVLVWFARKGRMRIWNKR